jgi:hypothetical protein
MLSRTCVQEAKLDATVGAVARAKEWLVQWMNAGQDVAEFDRVQREADAASQAARFVQLTLVLAHPSKRKRTRAALYNCCVFAHSLTHSLL